VTKDGTVFGIVTKVTKNGTSEGPTEGDLFRFQFSPDKKQATLKDLKPGGEEARQLLEGDYKRLAD
jgi:hypothetical protein